MDWRDYPALVPIVEGMLDGAELLALEAIRRLDCFSPSPEIYIQDQFDIRLFILPVKWQGLLADRAVFDGDRSGAWAPVVTGEQMVAAAPALVSHVQSPLVVNAMYSLSMPGCEIVPHIDREEAIGEVLRLHVGLRCPEGDCALIVDGERREWRSGDAFIFDSARVEHSAHNRTGQPRLILIIDLDRQALEG